MMMPSITDYVQNNYSALEANQYLYLTPVMPQNRATIAYTASSTQNAIFPRWNYENCSCVKFIRTFPEFKDMPPIRTPADLEPNSVPMPKAAILMSWGGLPHIGYAVAFTLDGLGFIMEHRYLKRGECITTFDRFNFDDKRLRGFYKP